MKNKAKWAVAFSTALWNLAVAAQQVDIRPSAEGDFSIVETVHSEVTSENSIKNKIFSTAVGNLMGYSYVHHAIDKAASALKHPEYVVRGIPASINIFQYYQYYIEIDVREKGAEEAAYKFRFLYQDASAQGHNNVGHQAWTGISPMESDRAFQKLMDNLSWTPSALPSSVVTNNDAMAVAFRSRSFRTINSQIDPRMSSVFKWIGKDGSQYSIVTVMTQGNLYAQPGYTVSMVFRLKDGRVEVAEGAPLYSTLLSGDKGSDSVGAALAEHTAVILGTESKLREDLVARNPNGLSGSALGAWVKEQLDQYWDSYPSQLLLQLASTKSP